MFVFPHSHPFLRRVRGRRGQGDEGVGVGATHFRKCVAPWSPTQDGTESPRLAGTCAARKRKGGAAHSPAFSLNPCACYLVLTEIFLGLAASAFGMRNVSTPFSNVASAFAASTGTFSVSERWSVP